MNQEDVGKRVVIIISEHRGETETLTGTVTAVFDNFLFEVTDKWGNRSEWNRQQIKGLKWKEGR